MAKTKQGPALFELLELKRHDAARTLKVPAWWAREGRPESLDPVRSLPEDALDDAETVEDSIGETALAHSAVLTHQQGRIQLTFGSLTAALVVFLALALLFSSFVLGKRAGTQRGFAMGYETGRSSTASEPASEVEAVRRQPPATHLVSTVLEPAPAPPIKAAPAAAAERAVEPGRWVRGNTYILAQEFAAGRADDARAAKDFLGQHGIGAAVVESGTQGLQLITTKGYNFKDAAEKRLGEEMLDKLHVVGAKYYAGGGGYRLEGYFKTLKGDRW